ncbi:sulfatase-like hydrolase/transferase [Helicobacter brantae]|uniref:Sulfatase N-terminal domain-containing protein n=1 Tax=Helicobacter brantae TaxID=375927 RepID=A0A3D8J3N9_9HELI|nr:sulfatase-like hydrolase/transferase [Helicobacter brantae]RDU71765.1 hypothetical protein CQA58_01620 [Helicobacter brantae]
MWGVKEAKRGVFFKGFVYLAIVYICIYCFSLKLSATGFVPIRNAFLGLSMLASFVWVLYILPSRLGKWLLNALVGVSFLCLIVDTFCWIYFDTSINVAMLFAVFETTLNEGLGFFQLYFDWKSVLVVLGSIFFTWLYYRLYHPRIGKSLSIVCSLFVLFGWINIVIEIKSAFSPSYSYYARQNVNFIEPLRLLFSSKYVLGSKDEMKKAFQEQYKAMMDNPIKLSLASNPIENIVLLLGESTQRGHMAIYGYSRATTPNLSRLSQTKNLLVFDDVISAHTQTSTSTPKIFSLTNYENEKDKPWYQMHNIVSFFRAAGYSTIWLSNQEPSVYVTPAGMLASISHQSTFVSKAKQQYDEELLPLVESKNEQLQFMVIHLIGTHGAYNERYPTGFGKFDALSTSIKERQRSLYDNAVFYNDYIVNEIFQKFSKSDSIVIYLSDHGEEIYELDDFIGHGEGRITRFTCEVPMLVYVSDLFIQKHPKLYEKLKASIHRPYMSDDLIHTILEIAGIETEEFDPTRSIINEKFNPQRTRIVGGGGWC